MFNHRVYITTTVAMLGSLLFGYDTGVAGSTLALPSFQHQFGLATASKSHKATLTANIVSVLQAGCFFGALASAPMANWIGRRYTLVVFCLIFSVGGALQTAADGKLGRIYAGRVIAGQALGVGALSAVCPTYVAECAPKRIRGRLSGMFQFMLTIGVALSYWINYGVSVHVSKTSATQWKIPLGFQLVPGGLLLLLVPFLKESPRWLVSKGRDAEARENLAYLRMTSLDNVETEAELAEIKASVNEENQAAHGRTLSEVLAPGIRIRFFLGFCIMTLQQWSGQNYIGYYSATVFQAIGFNSATSSTLASGVYGLIKVAATGVFIFVGIERLPRRYWLAGSALTMGIFMYIIGAIGLTHPPDPKADTPATASKAMAAMIYIFCACYSFGWGPVPWVYASEIFPNRLRSYGISFVAATQWLMNFAVSRSAPNIQAKLGYKIFLIFASVNMVNFFFSLLLPETRGLSLEAMDVLFGFTTAEKRAQDISSAEGKLQVGHHQRKVNSTRGAQRTQSDSSIEKGAYE